MSADLKRCIGRGLAAIRPRTIDGGFLFFNLRYAEKLIAKSWKWQHVSRNQQDSNPALLKSTNTVSISPSSGRLRRCWGWCSGRWSSRSG